MKKLLYYIILLLFYGHISVYAQFAGGSGTESDPWQIKTLTQLDSVRNHREDYFKLMNDLDFEGSDYDSTHSKSGWEPIGISGSTFKGTFDGNNYTIKNLYINYSDSSYAGLFGSVKYGKINNLNITVDGIYSLTYIGTLAGYVYSGEISNCTAIANNHGSSDEVGGLIGTAGYTTISNCSAEGTISGSELIGGLVGKARDCDIINSSANATIISTEDGYAGGLIGLVEAYSKIQNCFAYGTLKGNSFIGGLVGYSNQSTITLSYASTYIKADSRVGGLVGYQLYGSINSCYSAGTIIGEDSYIGGLVGYFYYGTITNAYTAATVYGVYSTGGLAGFFYNATLKNVYTTGKVIGYVNPGALIGDYYGNEISNAFYNSTTNILSDYIGNKNSDDTPDVLALTTAQLKQKSSYSNFDFDSVWTITGGASFAGFNDIVNLPVILNDLEDTINSGIEYKDTVHIVCMDNKDVTLTLNSYPEGFSVSNDSIISWTPSKSGEFTFSFTATDGDGNKTIMENIIYVSPAKGDGSVENPYEITTINDLDFMRYQPDKHYTLMNDLDFEGSKFSKDNSNIGWTPVGTSRFRFTGSLKGNGHTIKNLYINAPGLEYVGLFGYVNYSKFDSLNIINCDITGKSRVGGLAGYVYDAEISNCVIIGKVSGSKKSGYAQTGLLVGNISGSSISNSYTYGNVSASNYVGGLTGLLYDSDITNCYSNAFVNAGQKCGGFIGVVNRGTITYCYSTGRVRGNMDCGAFIGENLSTNTSIYKCYYNNETAGLSQEAIPNIVTSLYGLTESEMKQAANYTDWDFTDVWEIDENTSFPKLKSVYNYPLLVRTVNLAIMKDSAYSTTLDFIPMDYDVESVTSEEFPEGMKISSANSISWTPDETGDYDYSFKVTDKNSQSYKLDLAVFVSPLTGSGTTADPFVITSIEGLDAVRYNLGAVYELGNDLNFDGSSFSKANSDKGWTPIGKESNTCFYGIFNGKGFTINNLYINDINSSGLGLFYGGFYAVIDSLSLVEADISGSDTLGALVGTSSYSDVTNCFVSGNITGGSFIGGLCGYSEYGAQENIYSTVNITSYDSYVGGLVGYNYYSSIKSCAATGDVFAQYSYVGGLIGRVSTYSSESVQYCYATGSVNGLYYVGGLIGYNYNSSINNCYTTGNVTGSGNSIGGFIGYNQNSDSITYCYSSGQVYTLEDRASAFIGTYKNTKIEDCYYDSTKTGALQAIYGETTNIPEALSTSEMLNPSNFFNWDFDSIWAIRTDTTYPVLRSLNNAPFAFIDSAKGTIKDLMGYNYDYETRQEYLVYKVDSIISATSGTNYTYNRDDIKNGDSLLISYRVGEYLSDLKDTLWGNQVTSLLEMENHAPIITSTAPTTAETLVEYSYEVIATDEDGDQLYYTIQNAPEGMYVDGNTIYWIPGEGIATSGEVTVVVSDGIYTDSESFTIEIDIESDIISYGVDAYSKAYPNPVSDVLTIISEETINRVQIVSLTGTVVLSTEVNYLEKQLNLEHLENGLYIVVLYTDNGVETHRIIKN